MTRVRLLAKLNQNRKYFNTLRRGSRLGKNVVALSLSDTRLFRTLFRFSQHFWVKVSIFVDFFAFRENLAKCCGCYEELYPETKQTWKNSKLSVAILSTEAAKCWGFVQRMFKWNGLRIAKMVLTSRNIFWLKVKWLVEEITLSAVVLIMSSPLYSHTGLYL